MAMNPHYQMPPRAAAAERLNRTRPVRVVGPRAVPTDEPDTHVASHSDCVYRVEKFSERTSRGHTLCELKLGQLALMPDPPQALQIRLPDFPVP